MGKLDKQQPKLTFATRRPPGGAGTHSDTEAELEPSTTKAMESVLQAIQKSLQDINGKLDTLTCRVDTIANKLDKQGERLDEAETRISAVEDETHANTTKCSEMEKLLEVIRNKSEDLEARSRRNNVRISGVPETTNTGKMELYIESLVRDIFGAEKFSSVFIVERAHRSLAPKPPAGAPPRPIVARFLNYRDRDLILRLARERQSIQHQGSNLAFYPDFTVTVQNARKEFHPAKQKLRELGVEYAMLYPARLRVTNEGRTAILTTPRAAQDYIKKLKAQRKEKKRVEGSQDSS